MCIRDRNNLGGFYSYIAQLINFKNYGACSSRQRTVVIGVANDYADEISPMELFPDFVEEKTLRDVIGGLPALKEFGEIDQMCIRDSVMTTQCTDSSCFHAGNTATGYKNLLFLECRSEPVNIFSARL